VGVGVKAGVVVVVVVRVGLGARLGAEVRASGTTRVNARSRATRGIQWSAHIIL
jgi:hypothetical protein